MVLEEIQKNQTVQKAVDTFVKYATGGAIIIGILLFLEKLLGLTFDVTVSLGL